MLTIFIMSTLGYEVNFYSQEFGKLEDDFIPFPYGRGTEKSKDEEQSLVGKKKIYKTVYLTCTSKQIY